jgi:hypothetical protein
MVNLKYSGTAVTTQNYIHKEVKGNRELARIFGPERRSNRTPEKLHSEVLHNLYS